MESFKEKAIFKKIANKSTFSDLVVIIWVKLMLVQSLTLKFEGQPSKASYLN